MIAAALRWTRSLSLPALNSGWVVLAVLALLIAWDATGFDLPLAQLAGSTAGFPLRENWILTNVLHDGARRLSWLVALVLSLGVWWPIGPLRQLPISRRLLLAGTTLAAAFAVTAVKWVNTTSCPWDLVQFGGVAQYISHWAWRPDGGGGHCFPAGHAASGFSFLAGYFAYREHDARLARWWLLAALAAGFVLGVAQQLRGAHFMSHTLWTGWICWTLAWSVDGLHRRFALREV